MPCSRSDASVGKRLDREGEKDRRCRGRSGMETRVVRRLCELLFPFWELQVHQGHPGSGLQAMKEIYLTLWIYSTMCVATARHMCLTMSIVMSCERPAVLISLCPDVLSPCQPEPACFSMYTIHIQTFTRPPPAPRWTTPWPLAGSKLSQSDEACRP